MKKLIYTLFFVLISVVANGQAKYVFYFIGDGMGVNQVNGTEMYQAELQNGRIGVEPLLFTQFPVATMATTFSILPPQVLRWLQERKPIITLFLWGKIRMRFKL